MLHNFLQELDFQFIIMFQTMFPQHSEQIERLECVEEIRYKYRLNLMKRMTASLNICDKVRLAGTTRIFYCVPFLGFVSVRVR